MLKIHHPFKPFFFKNSLTLILGSFPSVKSREEGFYYGHPQNQFWRILAKVYGGQLPRSIEEKKAFLQKHKVALYDVIESCLIRRSSDASIRDVIPADLKHLIESSNIQYIYCNGRTAEKYFKIYQKGECSYLPSSSPAYAMMSLENKIEIWKDALKISHNKKML